MTHRVLRCLVEDLGFRGLAVDENLSTGIEFDRFLRSGTGNPRIVLDNAVPHRQNTESLDVLLWMRAHNRHHPDHPVRIVGLDVNATTIMTTSKAASPRT